METHAASSLVQEEIDERTKSSSRGIIRKNTTLYEEERGEFQFLHTRGRGGSNPGIGEAEEKGWWRTMARRRFLGLWNWSQSRSLAKSAIRFRSSSSVTSASPPPPPFPAAAAWIPPPSMSVVWPVWLWVGRETERNESTVQVRLGRRSFYSGGGDDGGDGGEESVGTSVFGWTWTRARGPHRARLVVLRRPRCCIVVAHNVFFWMAHNNWMRKRTL